MSGYKDMPLQGSISVIIPTYNRAKLIIRAIDSVLEQTFPANEIIIVDDGSTDETQEVLRLYGNKINIMNQNNLGPAAARNSGIFTAKGDWLAFLDSDDIWLQNKLKIQLEYCLRYDADCSFHDLIFRNIISGLYIKSCNKYLNEKGKELETGIIEHPYKTLMMKENMFLTPSLMVKRKVLTDIGGYKETFRTSEDLELYYRIARRYKIAYIAEALAEVTLHNGKERVTDKERLYKDRIQAIKVSLTESLANKDKISARVAKSGMRRQLRSLAGYYRSIGKMNKCLQTYISYLRVFIVGGVKNLL